MAVKWQTLHVCLLEYTVTDHGSILAVNKFYACTNYSVFLENALNNFIVSYESWVLISLELKYHLICVIHQNYSVVHNLIGKVNKHVVLQLDSMALRMLLSATVLEVSISAILQTPLNIKGYPHLPVSFHHCCRSTFSFEHKLPQKKNHGRIFSCDNDRCETLEL